MTFAFGLPAEIVERSIAREWPIGPAEKPGSRNLVPSPSSTTGQAAGTAAALAADAGITPREVDPAQLMARLNAQGANLGLT
ncbi:MAG: hypothetical protein AB7W28_04735 [Armatimonadota bacterium]